MPTVISNLAEVARQTVDDLAAELPGGRPDVTVGLLVCRRVHVLVGAPASGLAGLVRALDGEVMVHQDDERTVVPLRVDGELAGLLVWTHHGHPPPPGTAMLLGRLLATELAAARVASQREDLLRDYTSAEITTALLDGEQDRDPDGLRDLTVLFADLRGFTSFTERTASQVVVSYLNQLFEPAMAVVAEHGGTVANLMGDALMATFGAAGDQPDHPWLAASAGLALTTTFAEQHPDLPRFGVGINTGTAYVGNIGGQGRRVYTTIGDTVNTAARLEGRTRPGDVIIGAETYATLRHVATVEPLEPLELKGKQDRVQAYLLTALDDPARLDRDAPGPPPPRQTVQIDVHRSPR